jgi:predicted ATPase
MDLLQTGSRLVTLTGPGGTGKTRLAIEVAAALQETFSNGASFVPLAPIQDPSLVESMIAAALGVKELGELPLREALLASLTNREMLLVLDNCEHVLDGIAIVGELLASCPRLTVLATSRSPLHLSAEHEYALRPMALPASEQEADLAVLRRFDGVAFFVERAAAARHGFELTAENAPVVLAICRRLDGLPLALELAAARLRVFTPQTLLARLSRRLDLLMGGARDAPSRQQTLRAAIDWSYSLLSGAEQRLFGRLSIFAGGFSLEAAERVCGDEQAPELGTLDGVASLAEKSLVQPAEEVDEELRFAILETVREYGLAQLAARGEDQMLRRRHASFFLELAEAAEPQLTGSEQAAWLQRLDCDIDNLRAALQQAGTSGDAKLGLRLASALWLYWQARGFLSEGRRWLEEMLARGPAVNPSVRAKALVRSAALAMNQTDYARATAQAKEALELYDRERDPGGRALALNVLGGVARFQGKYADAGPAIEEGLRLYRALNDRWGVALSLNNLGALAADRGEFERARTLYEESLRIEEELGAEWTIAILLSNLAEVAREQGDQNRAVALYDASLSLRRKLGDSLGIAHSLVGLAGAALSANDGDRAAELYEESLVNYRAAGARWGEALYLDGLADVAWSRGESERAVELSAAAAAVREAIAHPPSLTEQSRRDAQLQAARDELGAEAFTAAWERGRVQNAPLGPALSPY